MSNILTPISLIIALCALYIGITNPGGLKDRFDYEMCLKVHHYKYCQEGCDIRRIDYECYVKTVIKKPEEE